MGLIVPRKGALLVREVVGAPSPPCSQVVAVEAGELSSINRL